jgi:hypothetical protein
MTTHAGGQSDRTTWTAAPAIAAACGGLAVAFWLLPATVRIVDWPASGPVRVALFAPRQRLIWFLAAAAAAAFAGILWHRHRASSALARVAAPLCLFWLWAVPYLPWLPDRIPLLLMLTGPSKWLIAALAVAGAVRPSLPAGPVGWPTFQLRDRAFVFASSLVLLLLFGWLSAHALGPGGDEPHYLIITHSLLADGDLQIENNHLQGDYRPFFGGELRPDYLTRGQNDEIYSIHAPGLPALLLPAYALAGYAGSVALLCLMSALTALAVFDVAALVAGRRAAWFTWAGVCFSVPFIPHAWLLFPEMPGALIVAWSVLWLWQTVGLQAASPGLQASWALRGAVLGLLPWLHTKFIVLLAIFVLAFLVRLRDQWRLALWFLVPIGASIAAWLYSFHVIYGTINPEAPYGDYTRLFVLIENIPRGLLGLSFDQKFGLFVYSPLYLFAIAGAWILLTRSDVRFLGVLLLVVVAAFVGSTTRLYMWWGGSSAPARFLVPVIPCLAPMVAAAIARATGPFGRGLLYVWLTAGLGLGAAGAFWPDRLLLFSNPHGRARLAELIEAGAPLAATFPTFTNEDWTTPLSALVPWLLAAAIGLAVMAAVGRRTRSSAAGAAASGCLTFLLVAGLLTASPEAAVREAAAERGAVDLLWAYDGERQRPFGYRELARLDPAQFFSASSRRIARVPAGPLSLPPGSYEARIWFNGAGAREGQVVVSASPTAVFGRAEGRLENPVVIPFQLPVPSEVQVDVPDEALATAVSQVDIAPAHVIPVRERPDLDPRALESIPTWPGGYLIYADQHAFPEGGIFWTRGTDRATVLVAPAGASRVVLTLHLGPLSGDVRLTVAGTEYVAAVSANSVSHIEAPVPQGLGLVPITIQAPGEFRPSDVNPGSGDTRRLGVQVRVELH